MNDAPLWLLVCSLLTLILLSAFFSGSETSMISVNRYKLRHLLKKNHSGAKRVSALLERPDRLLGVILLCNTLVNLLAPEVFINIVGRFYTVDSYVATLISIFVLTLIILIFGEVIPKTIGVLHPERLAYPVSFILKPLITLFSPLLSLINGTSNGILRTFGVDTAHKDTHSLTPGELRTLVSESGGMIAPKFRGMLINILDLEQMTVEDIMVPRNEVVGVDIDDDMESIMRTLQESDFTRIPVYEGDINHLIGILHMRNVNRLFQLDSVPDKDMLRQLMREPYFVPENTPLNVQLLNFQKNRRRIAAVVDEYGEVLGIVTMEDILEEIVGEFTTNIVEMENEEVAHNKDGSFTIDCSATIRDINRHTKWHLPTDGPKTLNGLIVEYLESIPGSAVCFSLGNYCFETIAIEENRVTRVRGFERGMTPPLL